MARLTVLIVSLSALVSIAHAQTHAIPGPGEAGYDAALDAKAAQYDLEMHSFSTVPVGWGLEAFIHDPAARAAVDAYFAGNPTEDFQTVTGMHPYTVVTTFQEVGDQGMFGGVGAAGDCFRYETLRDEHAPAADVAKAHAHVVALLDGLHWASQITGVPGVTARGIMRTTPAPGDPPLPDPPPMTVPISVTDMHGVWRPDNSGMLPFLVWADDTSKDQLDGYVMALGAAYDAIHGDASFDPALETRLAADARALAHLLMTPHAVDATHTVDLVIVDFDGTPTGAHDLNALELEGAFFPRPTNGFNAWMALGILRTLYAITGDADIGNYYYGELVGHRHYFDLAASTLQVQYAGVATNYSNVNMAFVAAYGVLRFESDPTLAAQARDILQNELYAPGLDRQAKGLQDSLFDCVYAGFRPGGTSDTDGMQALADSLVTLNAFPPPPFWDVGRTNCDAAEIASLNCFADDGTPLPLESVGGHGGELDAVSPVPFRLRPSSDYEWRSDPHRVNDSGSDRLESGQDFQAAYWIGRLLATSADGMASVSPNARAPLPIPMDMDAGVPMRDGGAPPVDLGTDLGSEPPSPTPSSGCGCSVVPARAPTSVMFVGILVVCTRVGRRWARSSRCRT